MSYQTLAQKYRPRDFSEVVAQESATKTLINSIQKGRVANAYLFCGPRGTGKTSMARLLSKILNCEVSDSGSPCNKCDSCREISQGNSIDVLEIDGASNRGIDEIRALRENVKFSPSKGKYKIYIIDEVHMLTTEAFNALLKTLEEPPAHVKFIFATTEPHKVLPTIMSRCQRFDFRKIPPRMIYQRIKDIASTEGINIDEAAVLLLARMADGSLRDALVVLDQMVSFSTGTISSEDVIELLGMIQREKIFELAQAVVDKDPSKAVKIVDELVASGKDPIFINSSLISHFRDVMVVKAIGEPSSDMAMSEEETKAVMSQKENISLEEILYILQNLTHCVTLMKGTIFARAPFEVVLIRMAKRESAMKLSEIMARIEALEKNENGRISIQNNVSDASGNFTEPIVVEKPRPDKESTGGNSHGNGNSEVYKPAMLSSDESIEDASGEKMSISNDNFSDQKSRWKTLLNYLKNKKMSVFVFLSSAHPIEMNGDSLVMGFDKSNSFSKEALEAGANKTVLQEAADKVMGRPVRISFKMLENELVDDQQESDPGTGKTIPKENVNPAIEKAMDVFGGHIVRDFTEGL